MLGVASIYSPEELVFLRRVMDEAVATLPAAMQNHEAKSKIAKRLLDRAAAGERDRVELLVAALADFQQLPRPATFGLPPGRVLDVRR